jgi:hypothetical protein
LHLHANTDQMPAGAIAIGGNIVRVLSRMTIIAGVCAAASLSWPIVARAQTPPPQRAYEPAPSFDPAKIPGLAASGPDYTIANPVRSDGFLRIYILKTKFGDFAVHGDEMLRVRLREVAALHQLEAVTTSESFNKALADAGLGPIKFAGQMIVNPVGTVGNTLAGVGSLFGRVGSGIHNAGKTQDDPVAGLLGVTSERRKLAVKLGVDPYTDFEPLSLRLNELSKAAAMGGLVVTGALMAIPGAAGIVVSNVSTANKLGDTRIDDLARDYTAAQIMDLNRQRLTAMGIDRTLIEVFLANRNYTPVDQAVIVAALDGMAAVAERGIFIERAAAVNERSIAIFMRRHAELLSEYYAKTGALTAFVSLGGYPFNRLRDGTVFGFMPIDALAWTEQSARALGNVHAAAKRDGLGGRIALRITGRATALARQKLQQAGWSLVENARP